MNRRFVITALCSLVATLAFALFNGYLGLRYLDAFALGIAIYYLLLVWIKTATLLVEKRIATAPDDAQKQARRKNYQISSVLIFVIDLCLIAPIILMVTQPQAVPFGLIPAITMATYTVYKIVLGIINYRRSKKSLNPTRILLKEINIIDALVSILTLQHTLIMVNGGMDATMRILSLITSIGFIVVIIAFSIVSFYRNRKLFAA